MIGMIITTIIATLGFILACISLGWQILSYHKTHAERIKGKLSITVITIRHGENVPALQLEIYNDGSVSVYIKSVGLNWGDEGGKIGDTSFELLFKAWPPIKGPIEPGDGRNYVLPAILPQMLSKANEQSKDKVWVSIKSQKKEVLRLQGDDLKAYLAKMVEVTDKNEKKGES